MALIERLLDMWHSLARSCTLIAATAASADHTPRASIKWCHSRADETRCTIHARCWDVCPSYITYLSIILIFHHYTSIVLALTLLRRLARSIRSNTLENGVLLCDTKLNFRRRTSHKCILLWGNSANIPPMVQIFRSRIQFSFGKENIW